MLTGLPDAYGRGRIIGDYRRVALYGVDRLIAEKKKDKEEMFGRPMDFETLRARDEIAQQIRALGLLKEMAASYGFDISKPAKNAQEAVQWVYFGYLAAIKAENGAAMSIGRVSTFLDIYFERDFARDTLTEQWSSSCAWYACCARQPTTSSSRAIRSGSRRRSAAWARTAARW